MALVVQDILDLSCAKGFTLCAGRGGLSRQIEMVDMLDFAWDREAEYSSYYYGDRNVFDANSFVISSLMFARDNPEKLYATLHRLIHCGVVGLAYKPAFYHDLQPEVLELADKNNFVIFRIESNATYREIIYEITEAIRLNQNILESAGILSRMLREKLDVEEAGVMVAKISHNFRANAKVMLAVPKDGETSLPVDAVVRRFRLFDEFKGKAVVSGFFSGDKLGLAVIVTLDTNDAAPFNAILREILAICAVDRDKVILSHSTVRPTFTELSHCLTEADCALTAAKVLDKDEMRFEDIGTLSFLIPSADNPYVCTYMQETLRPIISSEESMRTVTALVRAEGDFDAAAKTLCLHKNTLRYRIAKIRETLAPDISFDAFYEQLATAVKIFLIRKNRG